ncbi:MAG: alpha-N-arabinofuranosidase [Clostridia bacterium]|nr:alpha-N-arabinofuranosidase [Clostridia bacterium]
MHKITVDKEFVIGDVERDVWGSFIEHMGRAVYGGVYEPSHPTADAHGFRGDVTDIVKNLGVPIIRYPGGNFLSGYNWKDGIGKDRPKRLDLAWGQLEPNEVGLHEFCEWAQRAGSRVMMSANLGTGTPQEAAQLVEYCNFSKGSYWSDLRRKNGREKPFAIDTWCLGNEMDGDWQIGHLTAEEYGRKAHETAKLVKWVDKNVRLVVCGSSSPGMATYPDWDATVLRHTYEDVDYISLHRYYSYEEKGNEFDLMSAHADFDAFIKTVSATADFVKASLRSKKTMKLSIDEWNVWHTRPVFHCKQVYNDNDADRWTVGPRRAENVYDVTDAIALGGLVCAIINNADRVKMGCLAQLVNVIAPIMTQNGGGVYKQTTYYPYAMAVAHAKGTALRAAVCSDPAECIYGDTQKIYAACTHDNGEYALFVVNKSDKEEDCALRFASSSVAMVSRTELTGGLHDYNDFEHPNRVVPQNRAVEKEKGQSYSLRLPAHSFTLLRFAEK